MHPKESEALDVCKVGFELLQAKALYLTLKKAGRFWDKGRTKAGHTCTFSFITGRAAHGKAGEQWSESSRELSGSLRLNKSEALDVRKIVTSASIGSGTKAGHTCTFSFITGRAAHGKAGEQWSESSRELSGSLRLNGGPLKASWSRGLAISGEYERVQGRFKDNMKQFREGDVEAMMIQTCCD
ncbi:hypothetical protein BDR03DRAFT_981897 [Suillus americanus]|nr:hypothetical protein BDR03DRAFT_981897 [Suillus americanus]